MEPPLSYPSRSLGLIKEPHQASLLHFCGNICNITCKVPNIGRDSFVLNWQSDKCKLPPGLCEELLLVLAFIQK